VLYFVVNIDGLHTVWKSTPQQIYARVSVEPEFLDCLDQFPFATRIEAEQRSNALNAARKHRHAEFIRKPTSQRAQRV
jgi:hypothetical protein